MSKVWFITGSSRGLGREFVRAALSRGNRVAATARDIDSLKDVAAAHGAAILPLRVIFGAHPYQAARQLYAERRDSWAEWAELSRQAQG
ncbi:hypothetical protein ACFLIM_05760 [Nonomuraea sp. M3C6]|uniref:Short chain dehydrogenase n=1 Tax=Nonomuraea marmarensis TaxID=3351344 RepID=A0ABW7A5S6_9ACTN